MKSLKEKFNGFLEFKSCFYEKFKMADFSHFEKFVENFPNKIQQ